MIFTGDPPRKRAGDILFGLLRSFAFLITLPLCALGAEYSGSQACAPCHAAIFQSFIRTPMAQSSGRAGTAEATERFDSATFRDSHGAFAYTVDQEGANYYFEFQQQGTNQPVRGRRQLEYFVGSGHAARSYVTNVNGFLYEAPVAYYTGSRSWNAAPGYATYSYPYLTRTILPGCLQCHASGIRWIAGTQNAYRLPPFQEGGVACERCHGPGSEHIAAGKPIINPAKLAAAERDSVCDQCHLSGEVRIPKPGKDDLGFQPGGRLADVVTVFVRSGSAARMKVTSHVEDLAQSACKKGSGAALWCGTCHDPHSVPAAVERAAYFRNKCVSCHRASDCRAAQPVRQANGDNCVTCHMPRNPATDVDHVVFTDHSIPRRPGPAASMPAADATLVLFGGGTPGIRDLGLAYAILGQREQNATYLERAFGLLQQAVARGGADAEAVAYLAEFYRGRKDDAHALPLYQQAWQMDRTQAPVAAALGAYQMQSGHVDEAIRLWNQTLAMNPALVLVRANLAAALLHTGHADEARATMQTALEFNPSFGPAREFLERNAK